MASTTYTPLSLSSSTLIDSKAPRQSVVASSNLPTLPLQPQSQSRAWKAAYCRRSVRNVAVTATGEMATGEKPAEVETTELPEVLETVQEAWNKLEDKYAVTSLGVAAIIGLWGATGLISFMANDADYQMAIDRLPIVPGVLELVGIGYTGWFAYKNLVFKPDREELIEKIKGLYSGVI